MTTPTNNQYQNNDRMLRSKELTRLTGLSKTTLWRLEKKGGFPKRRQLSPGAVGWSLNEVQKWMGNRDIIVSD